MVFGGAVVVGGGAPSLMGRGVVTRMTFIHGLGTTSH